VSNDRLLGLIGGLSYHSTIEYYKGINDRVNRVRGGLSSARLRMHSFDFAEVLPAQEAGDWDTIASYLTEATEGLLAGGVTKFVLTTNTWHKVVPDVEARTGASFLHIAEPTARRAKQLGYSEVLLLGTAITMEDGFYHEALEQFGVTAVTPDAQTRADIDAVIFDDLVKGLVDERKVDWFQEFLASDKNRPVVLGCTELEMLVPPSTLPLILPPLINTTALHIEAAADYALRRDLTSGAEPGIGIGF
jgi:aspartate racemase